MKWDWEMLSFSILTGSFSRDGFLCGREQGGAGAGSNVSAVGCSEVLYWGARVATRRGGAGRIFNPQQPPSSVIPWATGAKIRGKTQWAPRCPPSVCYLVTQDDTSDQTCATNVIGFTPHLRVSNSQDYCCFFKLRYLDIYMYIIYEVCVRCVRCKYRVSRV